MTGSALKIAKFFGEAPKISPELLPETVAQYAFNLDLSSGDLLPYRRSADVSTLDKTGIIRTIYPMTSPVDGSLKWLHWTTDVDIATAPIENDTSQRIYFTGDGVPKVTNYTLATSGTQFPTQSYILGFPVPAGKPVLSAAAFAQKSTVTRSRDAGGTVTLETSAPHMLTTGNYVTTTLVGGTGYNLTNAPVTVIDATRFSYFSFGAAETSTADTAGRVDLAGVIGPRTYVYTYYSAWEEESVPSNPSDAVFIKEGQRVTVTGLPTTWTHGAGYQTTGMKLRVYRTVAGVSGTEYYRVGQIPLGGATSGTYVRSGNTITVTMAGHLLSTGDHALLDFTTGTATDDGYTVTVVDANTFTVTDLASGATSGNVTRTIGLLDKVDVSTLDADTLLVSEDYDQPDARMVGMTTIHNSMIVGFFDNTLCFCEPGKPHAWPIKYQKQIDSPIVGVGAFGTQLVIVTEKTPWVTTGNNPSAQSLARTDYILPCVSKKSIVNIGFGVMWSSTGGLAVYSTTIGTDYLTKNVHSWNTWPQAITPSALTGEYYRGRYFGSDGAKTFIFERNDQVGGHLVQTDITFTAAHYIATTDAFYYVDGSTVKLWNSPAAGPTTLDWKSKVFVTKDYVNFGAARIIADFSTPEGEAGIDAENTATTATNQALIDAGDMMGAFGDGEIGAFALADNDLIPLREAEFTATFQLFVNKQLVYSATRSSDAPFRLPAGYRADTFEVRIATTARVRAIHMAETVAGLRGI